MTHLPPRSTLFPYTTLFRSWEKTVNNAAGAPVDMPVAPFQYLESHDHSQLFVFAGTQGDGFFPRSEEHTSELQSRVDLVCRLLLEKKKNLRVQTAEHYNQSQ